MKKIIFCILLLLNIGLSDELLLSGSLMGCSAGYIEMRFMGPSFGVGMNVHKDIGVILECRSIEWWLTPWPGDYMGGLSGLSPFIYITKGIHTNKSVRKPVMYFYFGGNNWGGDAYEWMNYCQTGVGVKWTFYAVSPAFEIGVQRAELGSAGTTEDVVYRPQFKLTLEIGGWWPIKVPESTSKSTHDNW
jgi:hypothetical protein